jgi:hypothetical protein
MLTNITSLEALKKEAQEIQSFLDITIGDDPVELVERGCDLAVYISRTGRMLADAKYHLDKKKKSAIMEQLKNIGLKLDLPASTLNSLIDASCEDENRLYKWIDRMNRTATHQLEWCRTLISKLKEEMKYG